MKKQYLLMIALFVATLTFNVLPTYSQEQLAFPGAEGFGRYTTGGRGGIVYEVTNLNNSGPGSLRTGLEMSGTRTIVFRVSGNIELTSGIRIRNGNLTVAGQTAPGDGITIKGNGLTIDANNVIMRYIRIRPGDVSGEELDAMWGRQQSDIIIDHCTMSWSTDEVGSFYDNERFTMQWCILSESLYESVHDKGRHGYGGIWGGKNGATFHHNLLAHHTSRNPRFNGARYTTKDPNTELVDFRNNVIYNWGSNSAYGGENGKHNMIANYYKPGPATPNAPRTYRIVEPDFSEEGWYIADNYTVNEDVNADNWDGGVQGLSTEQLAQSKANEPFEVAPVETQTAEAAYESVLEEAGASYRRDPIDERIVEETRTGTATFGGVFGVEKGIIDTQEAVGGWPFLAQAPVPEDSDSDGMPDEWETANGLDPQDPADRNDDRDNDGYTNLEEYLNGILETEAEDFLRPPTEVIVTTASSNSITLSWVNNSDDAEQIILERSTDGESFSEVASIDGDATTYMDEGLTAGEEYHYRMKVQVGAEESFHGPTISQIAETYFQEPSSPFPANQSIGIELEEGVELQWQSNAPSYNIYLGTSADDMALLEEGNTSQTHNVNELDAFTGYFWRVDGVGEDGTIISSEVWYFKTGEAPPITSVKGEELEKHFRCSPNPFSERLQIEFELPLRQEVELSIYDMNNRRILTVVKSSLDAGAHQFQVNGGKGLQEGMYFCVLQTSSFKWVQRVMYLRK